MWKKLASVCGLFLFVASCTCPAPLSITSIQKSDKKLACKDIILEINEAEYYRNAAAETGAMSVGKIFTPVCWYSGHTDSAKAIKTANARIDYLGHIYDLLDCGGDASKSSDSGDAPPRQQAAPAPVAVPIPAPVPMAAPAMAPYPYMAQPAVVGPEGSYPMQGGLRRKPTAQAAEDGRDPVTSSPNCFYVRIPVDQAGGDAWLHEHKDKFGHIYQHSHPHRGPHCHAEDIAESALKAVTPSAPAAMPATPAIPADADGNGQQ